MFYLEERILPVLRLVTCSRCSIKDSLLLVLAAFAVYSIVLVAYRLFFHPLRRVPGPKLAAATQWYEFFYDICKRPGGQYFLEVERMHELYGPIVRVSPFEVHIKDPDYFDIIFSSTAKGQKRDKYPPAALMTGIPYATSGTVEHDIHRKRRAALGNFFSQKQTNLLVPYIYEKVEQLFSNIDTQLEQAGIVELRTNFLAFSTDLLCGLTFHRDYLQLLSSQDKAKAWQTTIRSIIALVPINKQYPKLLPAAMTICTRFTMLLMPDLGRVASLQHVMMQSANQEIARSRAQSGETSTQEETDSVTFATENQNMNVYQTILSSTILSPKEKSSTRLTQEAFMLLAAGGESCSRTLAVGVYHVLRNKHRVLPLLVEELQSIAPDSSSQVDLSALLRLPYLTALVREVLRVAGIITGRLILTAPDETLIYQNFVLPPGTPMSMTLSDIQHDPNIFRDPHCFIPERWLPSNPDFEAVNRFHVSFSRGSRNCLGINCILFSRNSSAVLKWNCMTRASNETSKSAGIVSLASPTLLHLASGSEESSKVRCELLLRSIEDSVYKLDYRLIHERVSSAISFLCFYLSKNNGYDLKSSKKEG